MYLLGMFVNRFLMIRGLDLVHCNILYQNYFMSKQTNKSTHKSLGFVSDRDIEMWSSDAKKKAQMYQSNNASASNKKARNLYGTVSLMKSTINNEEELSMVLNSSLNTLRQKTKSERSNSSQISNRIKYLEVDLRRKRQMAEIAKNKYQRMMQTRNRSFAQKSTLHKERQSYLRNHNQSVTLQANRIRFERNGSSINTLKLKSKNHSEAQKLKEKTQMNERFIAERQQMEVEKKRRLVEKSQQIQEIGRQKLKYLSKSKVMEAKQNHNKKVLQQFAKSQMQKRKANSLFGLFTQKSKQIEDDAMKCARELREYQELLGMRFNQKFKIAKTNIYVTN